MFGMPFEFVVAIFFLFVGVFVGWQFKGANFRRQNLTPARRALKREQELKNYVGRVTNIIGMMSSYVDIKLIEANPSRIYRFQVVGLLSRKVLCTFTVQVDPDVDVQVHCYIGGELSGNYTRNDVLSHVLPLLREAIVREYPSPH